MAAPRQRRVGHEIMVQVEVPLARHERGDSCRRESSSQLCSLSIRLAIITWSSTWAWTVGFSSGIIYSTRRSKLRGIQSAERDEDPRLAVRQPLAVGEDEDPAVLEEAADDRLDPDVGRQAGDARAAGSRRRGRSGRSTPPPRSPRTSLSMIARSTRLFILAQIAAGLPALALAISASISDRNLLAQVARAQRQQFEPLRRDVAGDEVEQFGGIARRAARWR